MNRIDDIMRLWMAAVVLLIFGACSSDSSEQQTPVLNIYVYAPGQPTPTRSVVDPTEEEKQVKSMTLWVYKTSDGSQLGSIILNAEELASLNSDNMGIYSIFQHLLSMPIDYLFCKCVSSKGVYQFTKHRVF